MTSRKEGKGHVPAEKPPKSAPSAARAAEAAVASSPDSPSRREMATSATVKRSRPEQSARFTQSEPPSLTASLFDLHASRDTGAGPRLAGAARPGPWLAHTKQTPDSEIVRLPPVIDLRRFNTTRLLPSKYSESVLTRIADNEDDLALIFALDNATNERLLAESNLRLGITARELVFGVPHYRIINAAFTHPHPQGGRFSMPYRGAWYAAFELATAKAEVLFHRMLQFTEIGWQHPEELDYDQYLADFCGAFHDLRPAVEPEDASRTAAPEELEELAVNDPVDTNAGSAGGEAPGGVPPVAAEAESGLDLTRQTPEKSSALRLQAASASATATPPNAAEFAACLDPGSYIASQQLTLQLMEAGSLGVTYPSARRAAGSCIACFRPSLVCNARKSSLYRLTWYPDRPATFLRRARQPEVPAAGSAPGANQGDRGT